MQGRRVCEAKLMCRLLSCRGSLEHTVGNGFGEPQLRAQLLSLAPAFVATVLRNR